MSSYRLEWFKTNGDRLTGTRPLHLRKPSDLLGKDLVSERWPYGHAKPTSLLGSRLAKMRRPEPPRVAEETQGPGSGPGVASGLLFNSVMVKHEMCV